MAGGVAADVAGSLAGAGVHMDVRAQIIGLSHWRSGGLAVFLPSLSSLPVAGAASLGRWSLEMSLLLHVSSLRWERVVSVMVARFLSSGAVFLVMHGGSLAT